MMSFSPLVCLLMISLLHVSYCSKHSTSNGSKFSILCPTWTYQSPPNNACLCGESLDSAITCDPLTLTAIITVKRFCVFFSEELQTVLAGTCPYGRYGVLPRNISKIKEQECAQFHRRGQLCGECDENYTHPVYSYQLGCVKCESYKNGWIKFIAAAFLPLTLFYIMVITFRISVTSSTLNTFVMVNQLFAIPLTVRIIYSNNLVTNPYNVGYYTHFTVDFIIALTSVWNLDFFRSFYGPICLYSNIKYQQVLLLEYAIGAFPLFLILSTYILVKLHDNFATVVWLWMPFHRCLAMIRRQWNIKSNLVHALATFVVLSYVKILNTSFEFLIPSHVFNVNGQLVSKAYWYYSGSVDMTSKDYLPYLVLAIFMLVTFNVLPLILLALYPFKCFQKFLNCALSLKCKLTLQIYMDTFHGCFEDTTHNYRHFATLFLAVRFFHLLLTAVFSYKTLPLADSVLFTFTLVLVAKFQPHKCKRSNTVDIITLLVAINLCILSSIHSIEASVLPHWLFSVAWFGLILIACSHLCFLFLSRVFSGAVLCVKKIYSEFKQITNFNHYDNIPDD